VFFLVSGEAVIFNVMGGMGTLVGPILGAGTFLLLREIFGRIFGEQFPYLIPLGFIFIAIIIFMPQGLLGFAALAEQVAASAESRYCALSPRASRTFQRTLLGEGSRRGMGPRGRAFRRSRRQNILQDRRTFHRETHPMAKFGIGQPVRRVEDQRFLTGQGRYVDDIVLPGQAYGVTVLSPHAHARIKRVDTSKAKAAPGVLAVLTGADVKADKLGGLTAHLMPEDFGAPKGHRTFQPLLVADVVRFVGDRVAFVVAETPTQARDAAELVAGRLRAAAGGGQPRGRRERGRAEGVAGQSERQRRLPPDVRRPGRDRRGVRPPSTRSSCGWRTTGSRRSRWSRATPSATTIPPTTTYTLYASSQNPHGVRMEISHIFHVPENRIRVVSPDVGGGFGLKGGPFPDDLLVTCGPRASLRRPVKWTATRSESMLTDHHGREMVYVRRDGARRERQDPRPAQQERCSRWAPISSAPRSPPAPSRSASCRRPTTFRRCI
jgi:hypothetical protein